MGAVASDFGLGGEVARGDLEALLRGDDPTTGQTLVPRVTHRGSAPRAELSWDQAAFTLRDAASLLGVSDRYLRKVAGRTRQVLSRTGGDTTTLQAVFGNRAFLVAAQGDDGRWQVQRTELERFASARQQRPAVLGYDVTFSVPKSVSVLWAIAKPNVRSEVEAALDAAVDAGFTYLQRHAATGAAQSRAAADGFAAAAFTHATSRLLDPQLHTHVVIANVTRRSTDGEFKALSGTSVFHHAKTAGYLAGAQLRHELSARLGVEWRAVASGIFEVDGVSETVTWAMSSRAREIDDAAQRLGVTSVEGRREIALRTRAAKASVDLEGLREGWADKLHGVGFDQSTLAGCLGRSTADVVPGEREVDDVFQRLLAPSGLTAHRAVFTEGEIIQAVADELGGRLDARSAQDLARRLTRDPRVLSLDHGGEVPLYTTRAMVRAEQRVVDEFRTGLHARQPAVAESIIVATCDAAPGLGADQQHAVARVCASRARIRLVAGPAGTGKTHAIRTAAEAWQESGRRVIGVAVQGTAAENLEAATGIPSSTLAALIARLDTQGPDDVLDASTVVVVDEASSVGTFDLARLSAAVTATDSTLVLVGDPAQHQAVAAAGGFAALVRRHPRRVATLSESKRQISDTMAEARRAIAELRHRETDMALHRLVVDARTHDAPTRDAALDEMVRDWANDRATHKRTVCMISEDHRTRRALIERAQAHLTANGELTGPRLVAGGQEFRAGDEVIARAPARHLHPPGAAARFVRNGTTGRVTAVRTAADGGHAGMWVDFAARGEIFVADEDLNATIRPGVTGVLTHSYALTSHAAQGATFDVSRTFASPSTSPAGLYVAVSRARDDVRVYTAPEAQVAPNGDERVVRDRGPGLSAVADALRDRGDDVFAIERDATLLARADGEAIPVPIVAGVPAVPAAVVADVEGLELSL